MRKKQNIIILLFALCFLFFVSCDLETGTDNYNFFSYDLQGIWVSNDTSVYSGTLQIEFNRITITDFSEGQTPLLGNDNDRPFKGFTKEVALRGYSEDGKIFIEDGGMERKGISYVYYTVGIYPQEKFLRFTFGSREEILKKQ